MCVCCYSQFHPSGLYAVILSFTIQVGMLFTGTIQYKLRRDIIHVTNVDQLVTHVLSHSINWYILIDAIWPEARGEVTL